MEKSEEEKRWEKRDQARYMVAAVSAPHEEESDDDTQDVLGAVTEGAEVVGSEGLLGFPVPQRHVVAVDRVMEEEDLGGSGHDMSWVLF